jgi:pantetheine-phosphate adenylyltransferase
MPLAVCPGSFDPITLGHLDIIERSTYIYDKVVVGVSDNPSKKALFSIEERVEMAREAVAGFKNVTVEPFEGLLVNFAERHGAKVIVKGLRAISDFEHEFQMAHLNKKLNGTLETVFMMASPEYMFLSSSAVKEVAAFGGDVAGLVAKSTEVRLNQKFGG